MRGEARRKVGRDGAEAIAIEALGYLAGRPEELSRFLALAGLGPTNLRQAASDPAFLAGVVGFLMQDEPLLLAFAADAGLAPAAVAEAGQILGSDP
jgi:hypothetical protein